MGKVSCFLGARWARLFPFAVSDRLLTFGEETEGVGFSPGVKKPTGITKGKKGGESEKISFPTRAWLSSQSFTEATE